jgi:tetratricopeptide (TPR) repeat protein
MSDQNGQPPTTAQLLQQGLFHHQRGEHGPAVENYTQVLRNDPQNADALYYVAVVACQEEQFEQGIALARRALEFGPPQARVHNLLGKALERQGDHLEAVKSFDAAIALDPNFAEAHGNRASILAAAGLASEALKGFERALALDPKAAADWINYGALLQELGRHVEALACYDKALVLTPGDSTVLMNRANALSMLNRFAEAEAGYDQVIKRKPMLAMAHAHKGLAVKHQGRFEEARALLTQARKMDQKNADTAYALGQLLLLMGEWRQGFPLFEARAQIAKPSYLPLDYPPWQGEAAGNFRLVVLAEQGLSDTIHFGRYASLLAGRRHHVTLVTQAELAPLMRTLPGVERVVTSAEELKGDPRRIEWLPLMSSMGALHLTPDTVPNQGPYLSAEPERIARFAEQLGGDGFKVGIVWQGSTRNSAAPLAAMAPLADIPGVRLIALQGDAASQEIAQVPFASKIEQVLNADALSAESLLDSAALIASVDTVVSIDAMPAHLAGALGRPVLLALPFVPDWRWLLRRDDTPWYPTMRLCRQAAAGDWTGVFQRIAQDLHALAEMARDLSASQP